MSKHPWWVDEATSILNAPNTGDQDIGALRFWQNRAQRVHDEVNDKDVEEDFQTHPALRSHWKRMLEKEAEFRNHSKHLRHSLGQEFAVGTMTPERFLPLWSEKSFEPHAVGGGTHADDFLDGVFQVERLTTGENNPENGNVNMASRASRILDFLAVTRPTTDDVVMDLGSGNGKLALTVAASSHSNIIGVEYGASYVQAAAAMSSEMSIHNARFIHADVRDVDLSVGDVFYLYYPFRGEVAKTVAEQLGKLASQKSITLYASGPEFEYGEYFLREVERGNLRLDQSRGEFSEVMVLKSE